MYKDKLYYELKDSIVSPKFISSLERIKEACDFYEKKSGNINIATVASYINDKYNGPKEQSIRNNTKLTNYIKSRSIQNKKKENEKIDITSFTSDERVLSYISILEMEKKDLKRQLNDCKSLIKCMEAVDINDLIEENKGLIERDLLPIEDIDFKNKNITYEKKYNDIIKKLSDTDHLSKFFLKFVKDKNIIISETTNLIFLKL